MQNWRFQTGNFQNRFISFLKLFEPIYSCSNVRKGLKIDMVKKIRKTGVYFSNSEIAPFCIFPNLDFKGTPLKNNEIISANFIFIVLMNIQTGRFQKIKKKKHKKTPWKIENTAKSQWNYPICPYIFSTVHIVVEQTYKVIQQICFNNI